MSSVESIRENGKLIGFAKITRDVTERHKMMDELRAAMEEAEQGAAAKSRLPGQYEPRDQDAAHKHYRLLGASPSKIAV